MPSVQLRSFGGLNTDTHIQDIRNGDYTDAKNIEHVSAEKGESLAITPRTGNKFGFDIGSVSADNKEYRITFYYSDSQDCRLKFTHPNKISPLSLYLEDLIVPNLNQFAQEAQNAFSLAGYGIVILIEYEDTEKISYILRPSFSDDRLRYYDFNVISIGSSLIDIEILKEAISTSRAGDLEVIGSTDLLGDLFVISSTKRSESFSKNISAFTINPVGELSQFEIIDYDPSTIFIGQEVYMTGLTGSNANGNQAAQANGLYLIFDISENIITGTLTISVQSQYLGLIGPPLQGASGKITFDPFGMGEIGVAIKNKSNDTWLYTPLLRSKELNFWVKYRCDVKSEISIGKKCIYFTDNFNQPKVFYYGQDDPYKPNGSISSIHPTGLYSYGTIDNKTNHITGSPSVDILLISQSDGGALPAGNIRYYARGVFSDDSKTDWSLPSRPVVVYDSSPNIPLRIKGDVPGLITRKQNTIRVTGINPELYKSIEIAAICYSDIGVVTTQPFGIIGSYETQGNGDFIEFIHTGNEIGVDLTPEELSIQGILYQTAKNNCIVDNRYILSNLSSSSFDFDQINSLFTYSLEKKRITRSVFTPFEGGQMKFGGYQDPNNVFYNTGYTINETYRIGVRYVLKNGFKSDVYYLFDVDIDTSDSSSDGKRLNGLSDYDLVSKFTGPNGVDENLVPYIRLYLPSLVSIEINNFLASDIIEKIEVFRVELNSINRKIKASGFSLETGQSLSVFPCTQPDYFVDYSKNLQSIGGLNCLYENPFIAKNLPIDINGVFLYSFYSAKDLLNNFDQASKTEISSGDILINYGQGETSNQYLDRTNCYLQYDPVGVTQTEEVDVFQSSICREDETINLDAIDSQGNLFVIPFSKRFANINLTQNTNLQVIEETLPTLGVGVNFLNNAFGFSSKTYTFRYNGVNVSTFTIGPFQTKSNLQFIEEFNSNSTGLITAQGLGGDDIKFTLFGTYFPGEFFNVLEPGSSIPKNIAEFPGGSSQTSAVVYSDIYAFNDSQVLSLKINNSVNPIGLKSFKPGAQRGLRFTQIKRNISTSAQYPSGSVLNYVYTGSYFNQTNYQTGYIDVLGGDAMTITALTRLTRRVVDVSPSVQNVQHNNNQAIYITLQSDSNNHLPNNENDNNIFPYSYYDFADRTFAWVSANNLEANPYNRGYSISELVYGYRANDPFKTSSSNNFPSRIIYSELKPQGSRTDFYRSFGILSYSDIDASFGEIVDMRNVNGELFTLQPNKYQRQFFNTRGTLQLSDASQIVLGDASVLSRPGVTLTSYGCSNKWSSILGKSQGGNDVLYWYDKIRGKFIRFGADGTIPLSDRAFVRTASSDGLKWILDYDSATLNYGMHGVWNQRLGEAIWTIRAYRDPDMAWVQTGPDELPFTYTLNQIVYLTDETNFINFEKTIVLYVVIQEHLSSIGIKPGVTVGWEEYFSRPSTDNVDYYSIRTISFSEFKNRFNQFQETYHPRIYLEWNDTFLSPRPADPKSYVYEHNAGEVLRWYANNGDIQEEEGYVEVVFNIDPNVTKRYVALICNSEFTPHRLELETKTQMTFINGVDFEEQLDQFFAPIPNVDINGQTGLDNDFMYGQWVKIRFYYQPGQFQRLTNVVLKFNPMVRLWNS